MSRQPLQRYDGAMRIAYLLEHAIVVLLLTHSAAAADFYIDPVRGSDEGDGSAQRPWQSVQAVLDAGLVRSETPEALPYDGTGALVASNQDAPVGPGDTLWLGEGDYGELLIEGHYNEAPVTIAVDEDFEARFTSVVVRGSANWTLRGLTVSAEFADEYEAHTLIDLDSHAFRGPVHHITVEGCTLRSVQDTSGWSADDWDQLACNGIAVDGHDQVIGGNRLLNVNFGISVSAANSLIEHNVIDSFSGDGMRGLGDYTVFQYNTVKNCYAVNANHDDGFQSWSVGEDGEVGTGEVVGIVLRGNTIINYEDPDQPHRGTLQGIGCFDGTFVDWVVENNVVLTDHWHGITLAGARNSRIVNNTVADLDDQEPGPPWINIGAHKNGTPPEGCLVRNNLTTALSLHDDVSEDHNVIIDDPAALFVDPAAFDMHLLPGSAAIDQGDAALASELDADRIPRPQGSGIDLGAYEWHEAGVEPVEQNPWAGLPEPSDEPSTEASDENAGCGCSLPGSPHSTSGALVLLAAGFLILGLRL